MITFEKAHSWLNKNDQSHISSSSDSLIDQAKTALEEKHPDEARGLLQQLNDLACNLRDEKEVAEILIECAHYYYLMDNFAQAESMLVDSVSREWSDPHRRAVAEWLLGCVQWQSLETQLQAVIAWRHSLADFERLAKEAGYTPEQHAWYAKICNTLQESILEAMERAGSYVDVGVKTSHKANEGGSVGSTGVDSETPSLEKSSLNQAEDENEPPAPEASLPFDILQLFTISEEIPAGDFGPSGIDPFPIGTVEIDRLSINGRPFSIHSTHGRKIIHLPLDEKLSVIKVKGDSMDLENITEKDFVLLRKVDVPKNGDIVMAEVVGIDSHATLKRYSRNKDGITLRPHSSNPIHRPFVFKKVNEGFFIRGVVVAILKPM